jgi:hypothetical protein
MWNCKACGEKLDDRFRACWKCGTARDGTPASEWVPEVEATIRQYPQGSASRYPALELIATVYRIMAGLVAVLAAIGLLAGLNRLKGDEFALGVALTSGSLVGGALVVVTLLAASEWIRVFIDIEENTRAWAGSPTHGVGPPRDDDAGAST